eukprot:scaffold1861_cov111-Isochrysis_galbana.AAC.1
MRVHVPKRVRGRFGLGGQIGDGLHQHVVRLQNEDVLGGYFGQQLWRRQQLTDRLWTIQNAKLEVGGKYLEWGPSRGLFSGDAVASSPGGGDLGLEAVGLGALSRAQPGEGPHLAARAGRGRLFLPVIVHDARLPLLIWRRLSCQQRVKRPAARARLGANCRRKRPVNRGLRHDDGRLQCRLLRRARSELVQPRRNVPQLILEPQLRAVHPRKLLHEDLGIRVSRAYTGGDVHHAAQQQHSRHHQAGKRSPHRGGWRWLLRPPRRREKILVATSNLGPRGRQGLGLENLGV